MEPRTNSFPNVFPEHVLVWNTTSASSSSTDNYSRHAPAAADSQPQESQEWRRGRSSGSLSTSSWAPKRQQHPLLAKLLEIEEEGEEDNMKHSEYMAHVLIQKQARDYAHCVEDALLLLRNGSRQILENVQYWRGPLLSVETSKGGESTLSWISFTSSSKGNNELELSQIGSKVVQISHAVRKLHEEDPLAFWTSNQRQDLLKIMVALSKDLVKLRRKLARIRDTLGDRVRNVRRAAIKCECEISGNIVPNEIYYQWVREDAKLYNDNISCTDSPSNISHLSKASQKLTSAFKKAGNAVMACLYPEGILSSDLRRSPSSSTVYSDDSLSVHTHFPPPSVHMKVYEIRKDIEFLRREPSEPFQDDDDSSVCDKSLESFVANAKRGPGRNERVEPTSSKTGEDGDGSKETTHAAIELEEVWSAKPGQKYLDLITSNMAPPSKFPTSEYVYDGKESRIREASSLGIEDEDSDLPTSISQETSGSKNILSEAMTRQIGVIKELDRDIHDVVTEAISVVREVERGWLAPPENLMRSKNSCRSKSKELYHLLDFIVDTARLSQNPAFSSRIYPEDLHEIKSVLDPVLKELTNAYMAMYVLHNVVMVDGQYLKELLTGFPKGSLVVRDWVSDLSIDEELKDMEETQVQGGNMTEVDDVDVDELFA